jgi:hypothetical protein
MRLARRLTSYIFQLYKWDKPCAMDFQIRNQRKIKPVILALHYLERNALHIYRRGKRFER